jgi:hypothetical protein
VEEVALCLVSCARAEEVESDVIRGTEAAEDARKRRRLTPPQE